MKKSPVRKEHKAMKLWKDKEFSNEPLIKDFKITIPPYPFGYFNCQGKLMVSGTSVNSFLDTNESK